MEAVELDGDLPTPPQTTGPDFLDTLAKEVANVGQALSTLSQLEKKCSEAFCRIESAASQARRENERLRRELARLQGSTAAGAVTGGAAGGEEQKVGWQRPLSRNGWVSPRQQAAGGAAEKAEQPGTDPKLELTGVVKWEGWASEASAASKSPRSNTKSTRHTSRSPREARKSSMRTPSRVSIVSVGAASKPVTATRPFCLRMKSDEVHEEVVVKSWQPWRPAPPPGGRGTLRSSGFFLDVENMKACKLQALTVPKYDVQNHYKIAGIPQAVAKSRIYKWCTLFMIVLSVLWLAVEAEHNAGQALFSSPIAFLIVEQAFCLFFFMDLLIRFFAFDRKRDCLEDAWFKIDLGLVCTMVLESWILAPVFWLTDVETAHIQVNGISLLGLIRVLRLARMVRLVRFLRHLPGMTAIRQGATTSLRFLLLAGTVLLLVVYFFAVLFAHAARDMYIGQLYFGSMVDSMVTLLLRGIVPDLADLIYEIGRESQILAACFLVFALIIFLTLAQLLLGLWVQLIGSVASVEKELLCAEFVRARLLAVLRGQRGVTVLGEEPLPLSKAAFQELLAEPRATRALQELGVDLAMLQEFVHGAPMPDGHCLFGSDGQRHVGFPELLSLVLSIRGSNTATVRDMVNVRRSLGMQLRSQTSAFAQDFKASLAAVEAQLAGLAKAAAAGRERQAEGTGELSAALLRLSASGGGPPARPRRSLSAGRSRSSARSSTWTGGATSSGPVTGYLRDHTQDQSSASTQQRSRASKYELRNSRRTSEAPEPRPIPKSLEGLLNLHTVV